LLHRVSIHAPGLAHDPPPGAPRPAIDNSIHASFLGEMPRMRRNTIRKPLALAVLALVAAGSAHAAGDDLFAPLAVGAKRLSNDTALEAIRANPANATFALVEAKSALVDASADRLHLNLFAGADLHAYRLDSYQTADGMTVWSGIVEETSTKLAWNLPHYRGEREVADDPASSIMLVKNGDKLTGNIRIGDELIEIRPLSNGGHAIITKNARNRPAEHPPSYDSLPVIPMAVGKSVATAKANATIRVQVNYTAAAKAASGDINGLINLAIAESNTGYANSGVAITMQLANAAQTNYTETGNFDTDLARYRSPNDGFMDEIHASRDSSQADVNALIVTNSAYCGLASSIGSTASTAFVEVYWDCATGYYSFAHEIGHLESARHDPKNDPTNTPYAYGHGYQYVPKGRGAAWRTIMAYDCTKGCPRMNYWSNPGVLYNVIPMGTASGNDNHRVLNTTAATVAGFR
jgi:hypothetical protein